MPVGEFARCHLWQTDTVAKAEVAKLELVETLYDDDHLIRRVKRCPDCGQLYFYEFYEKIDWVEGEDPQYRTLIPVRNVEEAEALAKGTVFDVIQHTPRLQWAWTDIAEVPHWVRS